MARAWGSDGSGGPPCLGGGTGKSEKLQAQGKGQGESGRAGPGSGGLGPTGSRSFPPGLRCSPALACSLPGPPERTRWGSRGRGGRRLLPPSRAAGRRVGRSSLFPEGCCPGSGWTVHPVGGSSFISGSQVPARGTAPPGPGAGREEGAPRTPPPPGRDPPRAPGSGSGPARAPPGHSLIRASRVSGSISASIRHGPPASAPPPRPPGLSRDLLGTTLRRLKGQRPPRRAGAAHTSAREHRDPRELR